MERNLRYIGVSDFTLASRLNPRKKQFFYFKANQSRLMTSALDDTEYRCGCVARYKTSGAKPIQTN